MNVKSLSLLRHQMSEERAKSASLLRPYPFINTQSIWKYTAIEYAAYLKSIIAHDAKVKRDKKLAAKLKRDAYKPKPKAWSWRVTPKGSGVISIRGRKPPFLYRSEYNDLLASDPENLNLIQATLARRAILIKENPAEDVTSAKT